MQRAVLASLFALTTLSYSACSQPTDAGKAAPAPKSPADTPAKPAEAKPSAPSTPVAEGSWPRFCGAKLNNQSTEKGLLTQWPKEGPALLWTAKGFGEGWASVAIANSTIYTAGNVDKQAVVFALDLDGKPRWKTVVGPGWTGSYAGVHGTPTLDGDRVYYETPMGDVVCLKAASGEKIWGVNILKEFEGENIQWALAESVLIDGERLICSPGGKKGSVVALDKMTGKTVWASAYAGESASYASPTLVECQGLRIVLTMNSKAFIGVNADSGELLFRHPHETKYDVNATMPVYHDGQVFITSGYRAGSEMLAIRVDGKKARVEKVWASQEMDNHHGGVILLDGCLYGASSELNRGKWICLDWKTGKKLYAEKGVGKGSLTYADGMLYTLSEDKQMGIVPAVSTEHKVASQFKLPAGGEGKSWAYPVICGTRLYIRHGDVLFAYDVRKSQ